MLKLPTKTKTIISIIINSIIVIATIFVMCRYFAGHNQSPLGETTNGINALRAFTNESNIFSALVALLLLICGVRNLIRQEYSCPRGLRLLQLCSTTTVALTFIIVIVFLNPLYASRSGEIFRLFERELIYTHFFGPLLAAVSFVFFTPHNHPIHKRQLPFVLIPILLYGIIYFFNVVIIKSWPDFYNFTFGGKYFLIPFVLLAIVAISLFIANILNEIANKTH